MRNEKWGNLVNYAYFFIDHKIISNDFIPKYVDAIISKEDNYPLYFIDLSLSKSLDEQFFILNDVFPIDRNCYKNLNIKCILNQIQISNLDCLAKISVLFSLNSYGEIRITEQIREDVYVLDDKKDLFLDKKYDLNRLVDELNDFFHKYT